MKSIKYSDHEKQSKVTPPGEYRNGRQGFDWKNLEETLFFLTLTATLFFAIYLPGLNSLESGTHPDEKHYLAISAEMHARGEWLTPMLDGHPLWYKPPLLYWAERICYFLFGQTLAAGRLPAAISAACLAWLIGIWAKNAFDKRAQLPAILFSATTIGFIKFGRLAMMDIPMALALTAAAWSVWRAAEQNRGRPLAFAGICVGLACLLKGPVAFVISSLAFGSFLAIRARSLLFSRWSIVAVFCAALVGLPWFLAAYAVHGQAFVEGFFMRENLRRFETPWTWSGEWKLIWGFLAFLLPWLLLGISRLGFKAWNNSVVLLALLWIGAVLIVFSIPGHKYQHYGLACSPPLILLAAQPKPPRWATWITGFVLALAGVIMALALRFPLPASATITLLFAAAITSLAGAFLLRGTDSCVTASAVCVASAISVSLAFILPAANPERIPASVIQQLGNRPLAIYRAPPGTLHLLTGKEVRRVFNTEEVEKELANGTAIVITETELAEIPEQVLSSCHSIGEWLRFRRDLDATKFLKAWKRGELRSLQEPVAVLVSPTNRP